MSIRTAQKRHARPMIARFGGTHLVDLAVVDDATAGMEKTYSYTDDNGETCTHYQPSLDAKGQRDPNRSGLSWPYGRSGGAGEVIVTDCGTTDDDAYRNEDTQPEPSEADGEGQNMGGAQEDQDDSRGSKPMSRYNPSYTRRSGGIG